MKPDTKGTFTDINDENLVLEDYLPGGTYGGNPVIIKYSLLSGDNLLKALLLTKEGYHSVFLDSSKEDGYDFLGTVEAVCLPTEIYNIKRFKISINGYREHNKDLSDLEGENSYVFKKDAHRAVSTDKAKFDLRGFHGDPRKYSLINSNVPDIESINSIILNEKDITLI